MRSSSHMVTQYPLPGKSSIIKMYNYTIQYDIQLSAAGMSLLENPIGLCCDSSYCSLPYTPHGVFPTACVSLMSGLSLLDCMAQVVGLLGLWLGPAAELFPTLSSCQSWQPSVSLSKCVRAVLLSLDYATARTQRDL